MSASGQNQVRGLVQAFVKITVITSLVTSCRPLASSGRDTTVAADTMAGQSEAYRFLAEGGVPSDSVEALRERLPYDSISIRRDPCFGTCPQYEATLYRDGHARYVGIRFVDRVGIYRGEVTLQDYARLCYMLDRLGFMALPDSFAATYTDAPTITLSASRQPGGWKLVSDYGPVGPVELWALRELVDRVVDGVTWEKSGS